MRAAVCAAHGPPESVTVDDVPVPEVGTDQVRIGVHAAAVNFPDVLLVAGSYQVAVPPPFVPGSELAGVVAEVGADVEGLSIGDRVTTTMMVGAFAEQVVVAGGAVQRVPDGVDLVTAAAFGVAHRTAYHVLRSVAAVQPGEELVVLGAGGGVGLAAVQLGSELGASVTAVASSQEKLDAAAARGATRLIDHHGGDLRAALREQLPRGADVVLDPVGGDLSEPALRSLRWGGRFVTVGFASGTIPRLPLNLVLLKGVHVLGFQLIDFATHAPDELARNEAELSGLLVSGRATPHVGATFDLADVGRALRLVADGQAVGKVVLLMPTDDGPTS
jgi:NADPH2:quinone reductase